MSLQILLAQYPNFSARKIRRLAKQLDFLQGLSSPEAKGIAADLMALTMQAAKTEAQLSDAPQDSPEKIRNVTVVPSTEVIRAVEELVSWIDKAYVGGQRPGELITSIEASKRAKGIVHGSSFTVQDPRILMDSEENA